VLLRLQLPREKHAVADKICFGLYPPAGFLVPLMGLCRLGGRLIKRIGLTVLTVSARSLEALLKRIEPAIDPPEVMASSCRAPWVNDECVARSVRDQKNSNCDARQDPHLRTPP
jgi:hypothetical protein